MFTKNSSLILSAIITTFLISASFPTMADTNEAGLPEKATVSKGNKWQQMIQKEKEEAAAEAKALKQAALYKEFKSMGKEVPEVKEPKVANEQVQKSANVVVPNKEVKKPSFKPGPTWGERNLEKANPSVHKPLLTYAQRRQLRIDELRRQKAKKEKRKNLVMEPPEVMTLNNTTIHPPVNLQEEHPKPTMNGGEHETVTPPPPSNMPKAPPLPGPGDLTKKRAAPVSSEEPAAKRARVEAQQTETSPSDKVVSTDTPQKPAAASSVFEELLKKRQRVD